MRALASIFSVASLGMACGGLSKSPDATLDLRPDALRAIGRMTAAMCEREVACRGQPVERCFERLRVPTAKELGLSRCISEVREPALQSCLQAIRAEECASAIEEITQISPCRVGFLCEPAPDKGRI